MKHLYPSGLLSDHPPLRSESQVIADREKEAGRRMLAANVQETTPPRRRYSKRRSVAIVGITSAVLWIVMVFAYFVLKHFVMVWG